ncbi:MAG: hypothetical protein LXA50_11395 [Betaproteobacteria bacterium]|nr:hypothetical protein [Betaproteobacteria bacterium]
MPPSMLPGAVQVGARDPAGGRRPAAAAARPAVPRVPGVLGVLALAVVLLAASGVPASARQPPAAKVVRERPVPAAALARASEAGGWWMIAQTACDVARGTAILDRMNAVLGRIRPPSAGLAVSERVQDPFLPEAARLKMEGLMRRVSELQGIAGDIRGVEGDLALAAKEMKPPLARLDRPEWKLAEPVTTEAELVRLREATDQALSKACSEGVAQIEARFVDEKTGILPLLR